MKIKYETNDRTLFDDKEQAEKYEKLSQNKVTVEIVTKRNVRLISPDELKSIFDLGEVNRMSLYLRNEDGTIVKEDFYETYSLDNTGHLDCTDYEQGLLVWSKEDNSYYRLLHGYSWKVELLGIERVYYF